MRTRGGLGEVVRWRKEKKGVLEKFYRSSWGDDGGQSTGEVERQKKHKTTWGRSGEKKGSL